MKKNVLLGLSVILLICGIVIVGCGDPADDDVSGFIDESLPAPIGVNAVSGRTCYEGFEIITFSATAGSAVSGTYERSYVSDPIWWYGANDKFDYQVIETGTYTWNEEVKTVTLKPEKISNYVTYFSYETNFSIEISWVENVSPLMNATLYRSYEQAGLEQYRNEVGSAVFNKWLSNAGFSSLSAYLDYSMNFYFGNKTKQYSFSTDNTTLFLGDVLPANKGINELSGQTYYGVTTNWDDNDNRITTKNWDVTYAFTASGYTYSGYGETITGSYSYDSSSKSVWLKEETKNGKNKAAIYAEPAPSEHFFADDDAYRAAKANNEFYLLQYSYRTSDNTIDWW